MQEKPRDHARVVSQTRVPVAPEKWRRPNSLTVFLDFQLDTESIEIRLPEEKLRQVLARLQDWAERKACWKRDLESLLGHLQLLW